MAFKLALDSDHWPSPRMNSAVPVTMLAFTYQSRYALHKLLSSLLAGEEAAVAVESLGDVEVRQSDSLSSPIRPFFLATSRMLGASVPCGTLSRFSWARLHKTNST